MGKLPTYLNEYDDFKVSVNREEIDNFLSVDELVANYSNYYLEYISFGAEDYGDIIFMCIDLFDEEHKEGIRA